MADEFPNALVDAVLGNENLERVRQLISIHRPINSKSQQQCFNLLYRVIRNNAIEMAKLLITSGFPVKSPFESSANGLLYAACVLENQEIVELLLNRGAAVNETNADGETPLHYAVKRSNEKNVELFLRRKANVDAADKNGISPLFLAVNIKSVNLKIVKLILSFGANVNCVSIANKGYTPLHQAVANKNSEIVVLLLKKGAIVNMVAEDGYTPLHLAAETLNANIADHLLNYGANLHAVTVKDNYTPLHLANNHSDFHHDLVTLFLNRGARVNVLSNAKETPLYLACNRLLFDAPTLLLDNGADPNLSTINNESPLLVACRKGSAKVVELLLERGAEANYRTKDKTTPLHIACERSTEIARFLLNNKDIDVNLGSAEGKTPLHIACERDKIEIVRLILNKDADVNLESDEEKTPLHIACENDNIEIVRLLLNKDADVNVQSKEDFEAPLHFACRNNNVEIVRLLLNNKDADVNIETYYCETGLHIACENSNFEIVHLLLNKGADVNLGKVPAPLHIACEKGNVEMASLFLNKDADVNLESVEDKTPLHIACEKGHIEIVRLLLSKDADVNLLSEENQTPLFIACEMGHVEIVRLLLDKNPHLNIVDSGFLTPLWISCREENIDIIRLLLAKGANPHNDPEEAYDQTVLCRAAEANSEKVVIELLNNGANINEVSGEYMFTPLHYAVYETKELVTLLLNRGADTETVDKDGSTPLQLAIEEDSIPLSMVNLLLENGAKIYNKNDSKNFILKTIVNSQLLKFEEIIKHCKDINNENNKICLTTAVLDNKEDPNVEKMITTLLKHGLHVDPEDASNVELLHAAVRRGLLTIVTDLLKFGADANAVLKAGCGVTPLHLSAELKDTDIAQILINYGANINAVDEQGNTPISYAVLKDNLKLTNLFISLNAPVDVNLLNTAIANDHAETTERILISGVDINEYDKNGITPLHSAAFLGSNNLSSIDIVNILLAKGANIDAQTNGKIINHVLTYGYAKLYTAIMNCDKVHGHLVEGDTTKTGFTALHISVLEGDLGAVKMLLKNGATVDTELIYGITALYMASLLGYHKIIEVLLDHDADVNTRDDIGKTPLRAACEGGHFEAVVLLVKYGADYQIKCFDNWKPLDFAKEGRKNCCANCANERVFCNQNPYTSTVNWLTEHENKMDFIVMYERYRGNTAQCVLKNVLFYAYHMMFENVKISHYDILAKDINTVATYAKNELIVQTIKSQEFKSAYAEFANIFELQIRKGIERNRLIASACKTFFVLFDTCFPKLPHDCVEKIFFYLSNEEIRLFNKTMK